MQALLYYSLVVFIAIVRVDSFFSSNLHIGQVSLSNIFQQFQESRISASVLIEPTPVQSLKDADIAQSISELTIFVVNMSMQNGAKRMEAVKGSLEMLLPKTKVSIVSCFEDSAELCLSPTANSLKNNFKMMAKSDGMCNLGAGLNLAFSSSEDALNSGSVDRVTLAIVADGQAHGLLGCTSECFLNVADLCDVELMDAYLKIHEKIKEIGPSGYKLRSVIIDTEAKDIEGNKQRKDLKHWTDYHHFPELSDLQITRALFGPQERNS